MTDQIRFFLFYAVDKMKPGEMQIWGYCDNNSCKFPKTSRKLR